MIRGKLIVTTIFLGQCFSLSMIPISPSISTTTTTTPPHLLHPYPYPYPCPNPPPPENCNAQVSSKQSNSTHTLDELALTGLLKASTPHLTQQLHAKSIRTGLDTNPFVRSSLIAAYSAFADLDSSLSLFREPSLDAADVPTWNSIISAYVRHARHAEACNLFASMVENAHLTPTDATYVILIGSCAMSRDIRTGQALHGRLVMVRTADDTKVSNCLITMYSKCARLEDAKKVFDGCGAKNVVSWNAMIGGYEQNGECELALDLFVRMNSDAPRPNRITFLSVVSAVTALANSRLGREVHGRVVRFGFDSETSVGNSLITMYGKCGEVAKGRSVFDSLPYRDEVSWNSMLAGYAQNEECEKCYELFRDMQVVGIEPDGHTLTVLLGVSSSTSSSCKSGREIHGYLLRRSSISCVSVQNAIVAMYAKSGNVNAAEKFFERMRERDSHTWNAMMDGYSANGCCDNALSLFVKMLCQGLEFDRLTISILLTACGRLVSVRLGRQFHAFALKHKARLCSNKHLQLSVDNALVSMYSKCGCIEDASRAFGRMTRKDVVSWTAMITGYAHHGLACESLHLFEMMIREGIEPNSVSFLGVLTACAHAGLVDEGTRYFDMLRKERDNEMIIEHYACMVDLLGRSGQLERAAAMVESGISRFARSGSCVSLWKVLLGTCHAHKQLVLGKIAAARVLELEPENETTRVLLSNLYAFFGLWREANEVRKSMRDRGLKKEAGYSSVEVGNRRHVFVAGDVSHPNRKEIYTYLANLDKKCRRSGYVPMTNLVLHDVSKVQKEAILGCHSEKLAVSFAVLQTRTGRGVIRVIKNLRICSDCHCWLKIVSRIEEREIVVRDSKRFHLFQNGSCSCGDYW